MGRYNQVLETCRDEQRVLVTLELDFANPLTFDPRATAGVAVLRAGDGVQTQPAGLVPPQGALARRPRQGGAHR